MGWKDRIFSKSGRRLFAGANFVVYTAVVVAMVVLVNWFVDRHNRRWDLTANQRYSLSAQTLKILKGLPRRRFENGVIIQRGVAFPKLWELDAEIATC